MSEWSISRSLPVHTPPSEAVVTAELARTVMAGLAKNAILAIPAAFALVALPLLLAPHAHVSTASVIWVATVTFLMLGGVRAGRAVSRQSLGTQDLMSQENILIARAALASIVWGCASWLLLPADSVEGEAFVVMGIAMILMGGAGGHAAHRRALFAFTVPFSVIFAAGLIRFGDLMHVALGLGFLVSAVVTILFALNQGEAVRKQIVATLESESLRAIADSASRAKTEFLAAASHDLRQPLHALTMFLGTLTFHVTTDDAKRLLGRIQETTRVLEEQFNSLLDLSKFDAGAVVTDVRPFRLDSCVLRLIDEVRPIAEARNLQLAAHVCPACALSDEALIARLLRNLLDNAVKYTESGSVTVSISEGAGAYAVEVSDTGPGIADHQRTRIFDEYVQLGNPARQRVRGVGLGLAIVRHIDRLLGLKLALHSDVGVGSRFSFIVPRAEMLHVAEHRSTSPAAASAAAAFRTSATLWVLDDDPIALESMDGQLSAWGATVSVFTNPEDLLSRLRAGAEAPDWIFTDDMLGTSMSGLDVARAVSSEFHLDNVCVITGNTEPARIAELRTSGLRLIVKPAKPEQLMAVIGSE